MGFFLWVDGYCMVVHREGDTVGWAVHHAVNALGALLNIGSPSAPRFHRISKCAPFAAGVKPAVYKYN